MDIHELRLRQRETLARDAEIRVWISGVERFAASRPKVAGFVFSGLPGGFQRWGAEGALKYFFERPDLKIRSSGDGPTDLAGPVAFLTWDASRKRLDIAVH